ncbi:MAG: hypothetical protein EOP61_22505 [Sphingomonadales bacterium]|nr:MAG: hypothetical protein EOP61_22505 [Sphingomonadales bacterium]
MMTRLIRGAFVAASLAFSLAAATAQDSQPAPASPPPGQGTPVYGDSIYVNGNQVSALGNMVGGTGAIASRIASTDAYMFVRCIRHAPPQLLRPIVEGHARSPATHDALDRVIRANAGCYQGLGASPASAGQPYYGDCNPVTLRGNTLCRAVYDRGALIEDAFKTYAPKFMLMPADMKNKAVIDRFASREAARGNFRSPMDRRFYEAVACMVQKEPQRAIRLLRAEPGLDREARLRQEMIFRSRTCIGNPNKLTVDPYQFRAYVADAVYHWTLAAKGVDTLVPAS